MCRAWLQVRARRSARRAAARREASRPVYFWKSLPLGVCASPFASGLRAFKRWAP